MMGTAGRMEHVCNAHCQFSLSNVREDWEVRVVRVDRERTSGTGRMGEPG